MRSEVWAVPVGSRECLPKQDTVAVVVVVVGKEGVVVVVQTK